MGLMVRAQPQPTSTGQHLTRPVETESLILEAWIEGYLIGSLIIMSCITIANMRRGVLLHKLILIELLVSIWAGTTIFNHQPVYGWYFSGTCLLIYFSYTWHNLISWIKVRPFLSKKASKFYIITVILVIPYWIVNAYANFTYYNNINTLFVKTRPLEFIFRDPWWIFTTINLFWNVKTRYELKPLEIVRISPRFAILLLAMMFSIVFLIMDVLSVIRVFKSVLPVGVNPWWKLSFVFKCLTDSVILDDFKTALDRLHQVKVGRFSSFGGRDVISEDMPSKQRHGSVRSNQWTKPSSEHIDEVDVIELQTDITEVPKSYQKV